MTSDLKTSSLEYGASSDPGPAMRQMEDASTYFSAPAATALGGHIVVAAVADGMGGPGGGAEAGRIAINTVKRYFMQNSTTNVVQAMQRAMEIAHYAIQQAQSAAADQAGMKSTLTIVAVADDRLYVGSVGDSRAYLAREGELRQLTEDRNWVKAAMDRKGNLPPPETLSGSSPSHFLGEPGAIKPSLRPVEFLWPGDTILLSTDGLTDFVPDSEIGDILDSHSPEDASSQLIMRAIQHGGSDNVTALILRIPGGAKSARARAARRSRERLSTSAKVLIAGNLLLLCLIELLVMRNIGFLNLFLPPAPTIEVAKPVFVPTSTPSSGASAPASINSSSDAVLDTPVAPVSPTGPVPAPSLVSPPGLTPTVTAAPTFTPMPVPSGWTPPPPPQLISPANGFVFGGPDANVVLAWASVGSLPDDVFYVAVIRKYVDSRLVGESHNWTKSTRIKLDSSFYAAFDFPKDQPRQAGNPDSHGLAIPMRDSATGEFQWFVVLERLARINPDGSLDGNPISTPSETLTFLWGPYVAPPPTLVPTPLPPAGAPTRPYGGYALESDPFFQTQQRRQATSDMVLFPVSTGMAGLSIAFGLLGLAPNIMSRIFRRRRKYQEPFREQSYGSDSSRK